LQHVIDEDGKLVLVVRYNGRQLNLFDIDHICCKLYLNLTRTVGTKTFSEPDCWSSHCHPTRMELLTNEQKENFEQMMAAYEALTNRTGTQRWEGVTGGFVTPEEVDKRNREQDEGYNANESDDIDTCIQEEEAQVQDNQQSEERDDDEHYESD